jgi:phosphate transport system substrate-binding protein
MRRIAISVSLALLSLVATSCGAIGGGPTLLKGAGATAPAIAYSKWVTEYPKADDAVKLEYEAVGSGEGVKRLQDGMTDFAASDIPLTDDEIAKFKVKPLVFPTLVGAIVPVFNVTGVPDLQFTSETLAGIFSGKIKTWNDAAIAKINPTKTLPGEKIVVVHRADPSGSTWTFTDYLSLTDPAWKMSIGQGASVSWPVGEAATGSQGMADKVKSTAYSIGYVELNFAEAEKLHYGTVKNAAGNYTRPDLPALGAAESSAKDLQKEFRTSLVNGADPKAYPIATLTWLIVPSKMDGSKKVAMKRFLHWAYMDGIKLVMSLDYGVLSSEVMDKAQNQIDAIQSL